MNASQKSAEPNYSDWSQIPWNLLEEYVFKLQKRIYQAEVNEERRHVRHLQRILLNSKANLLISIRRVTQVNTGKRTAGIDGYLALSPKERLNLFKEMEGQNLYLHKPKPAYRTYITKKNGKLRPLGIPTIKDRIYQNVVKNALEPQWEARFEPTSYGFRPKRSALDAMERINTSLTPGKKQWIFEGDFKGCFDHLSHEYIMEQLVGFPATSIVEKWLKVGFIDNKVFNGTAEGTPQGGIISPLLANIAPHGMEEALGIKYYKISKRKSDGTIFYTYENQTRYAITRYADDFVVMCFSKEDALKVYGLLEPYLKTRGLELQMDKTRIVHVTQGFDFLGFNTRRYKTKEGSKLLVKPSQESILKCKAKIKDISKQMIGQNVGDYINRLNPIIIGTANYWSSVVSKEVFGAVDTYVWERTVRFLKRLHPKKSWKWIKLQYYKPDKTGQSRNNWLLTDPETGNQLKKMSWTPIVRHSLIKYNFSPFDKNLKGYYESRDKKEFDRNNVAYRQKMAKKQGYKCPLCGKSIVDSNQSCETHHRVPKCQGGSGQYSNLWLIHTSCHTEYHRKFPARNTIPSDKEIRKYIEELRGRP